MEENTIDTTDRISMLPDSIVHHILSYLLDDPKSRVRVSVLSKEWFALTASFPFLYFHRNWGSSSSRKHDNEYIMGTFCKYVEYTVSRFCEQNISAHTLKILAQIENYEETKLLERCVDLVLEKGLQMLDICLAHSTPMFHLPNTLLSASSLTSLTLHDCELPSSLNVGNVKLKSLRLLSLSHVPLDEGVIEYLTKGCPLLEEICLSTCYGFETFCVKRHQNLLKVEIISDYGSILERIDVEAPNLSYFILMNKNEKVPSIFLDSCKKLTTFYYSGFPLTRFSDFLYNFQFLENVALNLESHVNNLKFSNHFLRKILLPAHCDLDEIDLNAPNLLSFEYSSRICLLNFKPLSREDSYLSKGCMKCDTDYCSDILWFKKLRKFLEKNSIFKVLKLVIYWELTNVEELKLIQSPPYKLEHVELKSRSPISKSPVYVALLDVVLWCFRPRSLTLKLGPSINKRDVVEFTYEKLLQQEEEGQTNIKFVLTSYYVREQQFTDLNSLLKALSLGLSSCKITFIKEEVSYMGINACTSEVLGIADTKTVVRAVQLTEENLTAISGNGKKEIDQREVKAKDGVDHGIEHMLRMSNNPIPERAKFGGLTEPQLRGKVDKYRETMNNLKEEVKNNLEKTRSKEEEGKRNPKKLKGVLCFMCIILPPSHIKCPGLTFQVFFLQL